MRRQRVQTDPTLVPQRPKIGLFYRHPHASAHCAIAMLKALSETYDVRLLDISDCTYRRMRTMQMVAFPGGVGDADAWSQIFGKRADDVRRYVANGGAYLGICMGAYWAGPKYFDLLPRFHVEQYIGKAEIRRSYRTVAKVTWNGQPETMFFWDGPTFSGEIGEVVATYANGAPMAIRQGRIGLIGCHPEAEESWYLPRYLSKFWHGGRHHALLRKFALSLHG